MLTISLDETYHIKNGQPLYAEKYRRVMSFHNGIAPVEKGKQSFFINENNEKLFDKTFFKAYGFYENLSAVKDLDGWFHIDIEGKDLYSNRYSWVGNFGESRCVVRDYNNNYFHIDECGKRIYPQNYTYTGDFKYGIAVVMNKLGKSTHILSNGDILHGEYFDELNIFHKGFAIAKDENGYFHINKDGKQLYTDRYQKIEDFYNGCAFATTHENNKIILNESDFTKLSLTEISIDKNKILNESFSYFKYQILFAILKLNVLDDIKNERDIKLPQVSQKLIFRWLYMENIINENNVLTELGQVIENELKSIILYWQDLPFKVSSLMTDSLVNASESFSNIYKKPYFDFLEENQDYSLLSRQMNDYYTVDYTNIIEYLNLTNEIVCDIGGGSGLLIKSLKKRYLNITTILADKIIESNSNSIEINFFQGFTIKSDVFILSRVLHDWNDTKVLQILNNIALNMTNDTILYILETIVAKKSKTDKGLTLSFHLLNFLGGYERTVDEYKELFIKSQLQLIQVYNENDLISVMKVVRSNN